MARAQQDTDIGVVGARLLYSDGTVQHAGIAFGDIGGLSHHLYRGLLGEHPTVLRTCELQAVTGACMPIPRASF